MIAITGTVRRDLSSGKLARAMLAVTERLACTIGSFHGLTAPDATTASAS